MNVTDVPRDYRTWVRHEGCGYVGATAWNCFACAIQSILVGSQRIVTDRLSHASQVVTRISNGTISVANVDLDRWGNVTRQYQLDTVYIPMLRSYHHGPACQHIDITQADEPVPFGRSALDPAAAVAEAERHLREVRPA